MGIAMLSSNAVYCIGLALILLGCILLSTLTAEYYPPYGYSRNYDKVQCSIESSNFVGNVCCEASVKDIGKCDKDFVYPCLQVNVTINSEDASDVILYDEFHSSFYGGRIDDCSYFHCESGKYKDYLKRVKEFKKDHKAGKKVDCYYDKSRKKVALGTIVTGSTIANVFLWSFLFLIAGIVVCVVMYVIDWRNDKRERLSDSAKPLSNREVIASDHDNDSDIETIHVDKDTTGPSRINSITVTPKKKS